MLINLVVKNFAIIDNISVDFKNKMTVLTGETGAGKSLVIDAISLLLGQRASTDMIRFNETKSIIEGVFIDYDSRVNSILENLGIDADEELVIKREILSSGKSICRINGCAVNLSQLEEISNYLGDVHSQFDTHKLTNPKNYLSLIDDEKISDKLKHYHILLSTYKKMKKQYNDLVSSYDNDIKQLDFLKYQYNELEKAKLSESEENELKTTLDYLNNYETIALTIRDVIDKLDDLSSLYDASNLLEKIENYSDKYESYCSTITDCYYQLDDIKSELMKFNFDESKLSELDFINERYMLYSDMRRKYKMTTLEIINYQHELKGKIDSFENFDENIQNFQKEVNEKYNDCLTLAKEISKLRRERSVIIQSQIIENLEDLELKNARFEIQFNDLSNDITLSDNGIDEVNFLVSFNKGETMKPLNKIASGGELSRFMLALKCVLRKNMLNQTIIFDEIDSGVSGKVAYAIASKISSISNYAQVLCITHLPQVSAICDNHLLLSKEVVNDRTVTNVHELNINERISEIAKMISNDKITDSSLKLAEELIMHNKTNL